MAQRWTAGIGVLGLVLCASACSEARDPIETGAGIGGGPTSGGASAPGMVGTGGSATGAGTGTGSTTAVAGTPGTSGTGGLPAGGGSGAPSDDAGVGTSTDAGGAMKACGSRGLSPCPDAQYCDFPKGAQCGATDAGGQCKPRPQNCTKIYAPVCGCDGMTHASACTAASAGISVKSEGECGAASGGDYHCDTTKVLCKIAQPQCPVGQVVSVDGTCYGPCVAIEACVCKVATDCPMNDKYTCLVSTEHCTPYLL